jgi:hypothetical protein
VCQSWKKNPNTSSQWAIPHDKNITLKKEKRKKKRKQVKLQCPLCILEILTKASIQKCHISHAYKHEDIDMEWVSTFNFLNTQVIEPYPYTNNWMKFCLLKRWEIKVSNLQTIRDFKEKYIEVRYRYMKLLFNKQ